MQFKTVGTVQMFSAQQQLNLFLELPPNDHSLFAPKFERQFRDGIWSKPHCSLKRNPHTPILRELGNMGLETNLMQEIIHTKMEDETGPETSTKNKQQTSCGNLPESQTSLRRVGPSARVENRLENRFPVGGTNTCKEKAIQLR